jgi:hypothetical protein
MATSCHEGLQILLKKKYHFVDIQIPEMDGYGVEIIKQPPIHIDHFVSDEQNLSNNTNLECSRFSIQTACYKVTRKRQSF